MNDYKNYKITLVIPTYNRPSCMQEMLNSSIKKLAHFSILLLIGDSSNNDETREIVYEYQKNYKNIKYIRYQETISLSEKQMELLSYIHTDYFCLCSDSYIFTDIFYKHVNEIMTENRDIYVLINKKDNILGNKAGQYNSLVEMFGDFGINMTKFNVVFVKTKYITTYDLNKFKEKHIDNLLNYFGLYFKILPSDLEGRVMLDCFHYNSKYKKGSWWSSNAYVLEVWLIHYWRIIKCLPANYNPYKMKAYKSRFNIWWKPTYIAFLSLREKKIWDYKMYKQYEFYLKNALSKEHLYAVEFFAFVPRMPLTFAKNRIRNKKKYLKNEKDKRLEGEEKWIGKK